MKTKQTIYRQGDVLIQRVDQKPKNLTPIPREGGKVVLAHGEVTGHSHAISETGVEFGRDETGATYLEIANALAMLTHQEHGTIELPRGTYRVTRQREYSPEAIRNVAD